MPVNLNLLKHDKKICDMLTKNECNLLTDKPTTKSDTLIDHIYNNDEISNIICSGVI